MNDQPAVQLECPAPASREDLFACLAGLAIETTTREHPPVFTVEEARSLRGASFHDHAYLMRSACRNKLLPGARSETIGFRIARTLRADEADALSRR